MASPNDMIFPRTGVPTIDGLLSGASWALGPDRTLTWSISVNNGWSWNDQSAATAFLANALQQWSDVANVDFQFVGFETLASHDADLTFTLANGMWGYVALGVFPSRAFGDSFLSSIGLGRAAFPHPEGSVIFNTDFSYLFNSTNPGSFAFHVAVHEIGHALGLKHPFDDGAASYPTFAALGIGSLNVGTESIMSYDETSTTWPYGWAATPMMLDIAAIQAIYGANTRYHLPAESCRIVDDGEIRALWDSAGIDLLDARAITHGLRIDIRPGGLTQVSTLTAVGIAYGTTVRGVVATAGADTVICNDAGDRVFTDGGNDTVRGGGGNDTLIAGWGAATFDGGGGVDKAVLPVVRRQAALAGSPTSGAASGLPPAMVSAPGVSVALTSVESIGFIDGTLAYGADAPEAQAARLYQAAFGRVPDAGGLSYWASALQGGASPADLAGGFLAGAEFQARYGNNLDDAGFVNALYTNVLGRPADAGGTAYWTGALAGGTSRAQVLASFSESPENRADTAPLLAKGLWAADPNAASVARLYYTTLGRAPDAAGLAYWTNQIENGGPTLQQEANLLVTSGEFTSRYGSLDDTGFVNLLYQNVLGRDADPAGLATWAAELAQGTSRTSVVLSFSESTELKARLYPVIEQSGIVMA